MVNYYVKKITNKVINPKTGKEWCIDDVPTLWKSKVELELSKLEDSDATEE